MSPHQAAALGIRLFAIWLAIYCARWAPYLYGVARESDDGPVTLVAALAALLSLAAVLLLWFFPRSVARAILPASDARQASAPAPDAWLAIGCTLLGLWVLATAVPYLVETIYVTVVSSRNNVELPPAWSSRLVYALLEIVIGAWLVLGASGLRRVIRWARGREQ